jgi:hypothetical protein
MKQAREKDWLAAVCKHSGIQRRFPIKVGTRSRAFPDPGSGCPSLRNVRLTSDL